MYRVARRKNLVNKPIVNRQGQKHGLKDPLGRQCFQFIELKARNNESDKIRQKYYYEKTKHHKANLKPANCFGTGKIIPFIKKKPFRTSKQLLKPAMC